MSTGGPSSRSATARSRSRSCASARPCSPTSPASRPSCAAATGRCPTRAPGIRRARPIRPNPAFGETWTASAAGSVGGVTYKAGETITFNGLAPATSAAAWDRDQGKPFKLYPTDVYEEGFAVEVETSVVRTTQANADEIGVELTFPRGLAHIENDPPGKRADRTVNIRIRQSPAGAEHLDDGRHQDRHRPAADAAVHRPPLAYRRLRHRRREPPLRRRDHQPLGLVRRGAQLRPVSADRAQNDHHREPGRGPRRRHARRPHPVLGAAAGRARRVPRHRPDHRPRLRRGERHLGLAADKRAGGARPPRPAAPVAAAAGGRRRHRPRPPRRTGTISAGRRAGSTTASSRPRARSGRPWSTSAGSAGRRRLCAT